MSNLEHLLRNNNNWAAASVARDPDFFNRLVDQQSPEYLWIGCSDSRVPANEIVGLLPGELFVHRNVANVVVPSDLNCLSVIQFAVDVLRVKHVIVCGHYGCGGVQAAYEGKRLGLIDNWLRHVQFVLRAHRDAIEALPESERRSRLCELNVIEQMQNVACTSILQNAWQRGQEVTVHGWIYDLRDGRARELGTAISGLEDIEADIQRSEYP